MFFEGKYPNGKVTAQLEVEPAYSDFAVSHVSLYATETFGWSIYIFIMTF